MDSAHTDRTERRAFWALVPGTVIAVSLVLAGIDALWAQTAGRVIYMAAVRGYEKPGCQWTFVTVSPRALGVPDGFA
jgi:hypothetical protein